MVKRLLFGLGIFTLSMLSACAGVVDQKPHEILPETTQLDCHTTYRHGCKYLGQIVPWDQWVEMKGYSLKEYEIKEIQTSGTMSKVILIKR